MRRRVELSTVSLGVVLCVALLARPASAQSVGATLQGTVTDPQGAVMPGAVVVVTNVDTGWTREQVSDERGWFRLPALPAGVYELKAQLTGFATQVRRGLTLTTGQEATIALSLQLSDGVVPLADN